MTATAKRNVDPRDELWKAIGDISGVTVMHNQVLVATYIRPDHKDLGNGHKLFLSDKTRDEDMWQGKVGLVVSKGPMAFKDDDNVKFHGQNVERGDWIAYRSADGHQLKVNGVHCRMLTDTTIRMKLSHPEAIY